MNTFRKLLGSSCLPLLIAALIASGCEDKSAPNSRNSGTPAPTQIAVNETSTSEPAASAVPAPSSSPAGNEHDAQVSSNTSNSGEGTSSPSVKQEAKPKVAAKDAYQQQKPSLMGLQLGASETFVLGRFGEPANHFVMDEDKDAINVYEYSDFSVGFDAGKKLVFVDVHTGDIDPGLGGLRLGQKLEDAVRILGKPDSNTSFVLSYKAHETILKLDIDPKVNTIQSIKLFGNE